MSEERMARIEELAWRSHAREARPRVLSILPGGSSAPVRFLDFTDTREHAAAFRAAVAQTPTELVEGLEECWSELERLWTADDSVVVLPDLDEVGALVVPFRYLSVHRDFFLGRGKGALNVADLDLRGGFAFLSGETENELRRWGTANVDPSREQRG